MQDVRELPVVGVTLSDPWDAVVRNDYARAVHGTLLTELGVEGARAFWSRYPLHRSGRALTPRELGEHVWRDDATSPLAWMTGLVTELEKFLVDRDRDFASFAESTRRHANHGSFVQARHLVLWLSPILVPLFRFGDPHRLVLHGTRLVASKMGSKMELALVRWRGTPPAGRRSGSLWLRHPGLDDGSLPPWDFSIAPGLEMLAAPRIFGLPPFESMVPICDARRAASIPWNASTRREGDRFLIDGTVYGRAMRLGEFLGGRGYDPGLFGPDREVITIECDYVCAKRKRVVLASGCAYGAPGYLMRLAWKPAQTHIKNFLRFAHSEIGNEADETQRRLEELQRRYIDAVSDVISVTYFEADESIQVGGRHVCRGTPARILRECTRIAIAEGRYEFSFRELKRLPGMVSHPKNTGFETRLNRLRSALAAADCGLAVEPAGRGRFALVASGRLELDG